MGAFRNHALVAALLPCLACADPLTNVNACTSPGQLRELLITLATRRDAASGRAMLWGSVLYEGVKSKGERLPKEAFQAGERAAKPLAKDVRTRSLQVWWEQVVGSRQRIPDFRKDKIYSYDKVWLNGKLTTMPSYYNPDEFRMADELKAEVARMMRDASLVDTLQVYRFWNDPTGKLVSDGLIASIAADLNSPFRNFAIAELALREKKRGKPGPYAARWTRIRAANAKALSIRCLVQREREQLAKK